MLSIFLFKYAAALLGFLSGLLPEAISTLPDWVVTGWGYIIAAVGAGIHFLSWLFPNDTIYRAFCGLALDLATVSLSVRFFYWITNTIRRIKAS